MLWFDTEEPIIGNRKNETNSARRARFLKCGQAVRRKPVIWLHDVRQLQPAIAHLAFRSTRNECQTGRNRSTTLKRSNSELKHFKQFCSSD